MDPRSRIYVAGAETPIGAAIVQALLRRGFAAVDTGADGRPDLTDSRDVDTYIRSTRPEYLIVAAGRSGGICVNQRAPADLMLDNLVVTANIVRSAHQHGVRKLLYLGSSCAYPRGAAQPMVPSALLTGPLEGTSEYYALAKIAGLKLCQAYRRQHGASFITAIPADAFGPADHFDDENGHVVAALIGRMHEAKVAGASAVTVWGSGAPRRDFIYADDVGDACAFVLEHYDGDLPINIGSGADTSIAEVAAIVRDVVGFTGRLEFDATRPDGMPLKLLDVSALRALGWLPRTPLAEAVRLTYDGFLAMQPVAQLTHGAQQSGSTRRP